MTFESQLNNMTKRKSVTVLSKEETPGANPALRNSPRNQPDGSPIISMKRNEINLQKY
jgi:hypothetical protein